MVTTSGFANAPVSRTLILLSIFSSITISVLDIKYLLPIKPIPHLWPYLQFSRLLTYQSAYTSSTELLFSSVLLYHFRVIERLWGSKKYLSFLFIIFMINIFFIPLICLFLKVITFGNYNYIPSGMIGLVFATLSIWREEIPRLYRYKILTTSFSTTTATIPQRRQGDVDGDGDDGERILQPGITLSDKSTTYILAIQLALSQFPYQIIPAFIGWLIGSAWIGDLLPGGLSRWRVPRWIVGEVNRGKERGQYEGLRRRLEEEGGAADGMRNVSDRAMSNRDNTERRGFSRQILGYFTSS